MAPWSKQHELGQLPWIIATPPEALQINIDPLKILPIPRKAQTHAGNPILKDDYAETIGTNYELRAPDYSYLVIAELKDFYYKKFDIFRLSKNKTIQLLHLLQQCLQQFQDKATAISSTVESLAHNATDDNYKYLSDFAQRLHRSANHAYKNYTFIHDHIDLILQQPEEPINLHGFKKIPPLNQVPVPSSYTTRLKVIYTVATQAVYKAEATITAIETSTDQFEASVNIQGSTHKYSDVTYTNAASVEAAAIYYSLKHITNILGYQIVDLNYPTLAQLIVSINSLSLHIGLLQCCVSYATADMSQIYESMGHLLNEYSMTADDIPNTKYLDDAMKELDDTITNFHKSINSSADHFIDSKIQFISTTLDTEPLAVTPSRWINIDKPGNHQV